MRTELHATPRPNGQRWFRRFDGVPFVTDQAAHPGALLEFVDPLALTSRLGVDGGALLFAQAPTRLGRPGGCGSARPDTATGCVGIAHPASGRSP